ncbi:MAG TPA: mannosyltransferase family protein [Chthoniobacterales bacterium]|nr:mannosyltransferase family protein [Chthoniobacterales bacterium]
MNLNAPEPSSRWRLFWDNAGWVLLMFAVSRCVVVMLIWLSRHIIERGPHVFVSGQMQHGGNLLDLLTQWDGAWYRLLAKQGYGPPTPEIVAAFFPVYPLLVRGVAFVVRDLQVASLIVSNGCLLAAALLFIRLLRLDYDEPICRRAITFLMFNPVSFFLSAAYAESTFLLLSIGALLAARQGKWLGAALCGGCLSATRAPGLVIGAPLLAEYILQWRGRGAELRAFFRPHLLWLVLIPAGLAIYLFYFYIERGDFLVPMHSQARGWEKRLAFPWQTFLWPTSFPASLVPLYQAIVGAAIILTAAGFFLKMRATYLVYAVAALLFYLMWGSLEGLPRYVSILFPIHIILALLSSRWQWMYEPLLAFSVALLALCTVLFANAYHMT